MTETSETLYPNTIRSLSWGIQNFDGIEFDIRLSKDNVPVLHHDAYLKTGEVVAEHTWDDLEKLGVESFESFLNNEVISSEASGGKTLWLELKPDCDRKKRLVHVEAADRLAIHLCEVIDRCETPKSSLRIISFATDLLTPFVREGYKCYPILPDINECAELKGVGLYTRIMPAFMRRSLFSHGKRAKKQDWAGLMFARQYVTGPMSFRHPSFNKLLKLKKQGLQLGMNTVDLDDEQKYKAVIRFTDHAADYPRHGDDEDNQIIMHRGCGMGPFTP